MINVDRTRKLNGKVIRPAQQWRTAAKKRTTQAITEGAAHEVSDLYRSEAVKLALEQLFDGKCAYCESKPGAVSFWDVEHYRPKGRVLERLDHPGYYWLAYTWENLYFSCQYCNQNRKDPALPEDPTTGKALGKIDQFPIEDETKRAMQPGDDLTQEVPLLFDPCDLTTNPEDHLTYNVLGEIVPVDLADKRATETIRICHLNRRRLKKERVKVIVNVSKTLTLLAQVRAMGTHPEIEAGLQDLLTMFIGPEAEYAGTARAVQRDPHAFGISS